MTSTLSTSATNSYLQAVSLGRENRKQNIHVTACPAIDADTTAKSRAFTHALQTLDRHSPFYDFAELADCLSSIVPGNHVTAQTQASEAAAVMRNSLFQVKYLSADCFLHHDKSPADPAVLHAPAVDRPAGIQFLRVRFLIDVNHFVPVGAKDKLTVPPFLGNYDITLPQSPMPARQGNRGRELFPNTNRTDPNTPPPPTTLQRVQGLLHYTFPRVIREPATPQPVNTHPPAPLIVPPHPSDPASTTYLGNLSFLRNQDIFDMTIERPNLSPDTQARWETFLKNFEWKLFCCLVRADYVGDDSLTESNSLFDFRDDFRDLKMVINKVPVDRQKEFDSVDALYVAYQARIPALPENARAWPMDLPTMFYDALPSELRDTMKNTQAYTLPDRSQLITKESQIDALRTIRSAACAAHKCLKDQQAMVLRLMKDDVNSVTNRFRGMSSPTRQNNHPPKKHKSVAFATELEDPTGTVVPAIPVAEAYAANFRSPAEITLSRHQPPDQQTFPRNPFTNYTSNYYLRQDCCFACGPNTPDGHKTFNTCPHRNEPSAKQRFYKELHCHSKKARDKFYLYTSLHPLPPNYKPHKDILPLLSPAIQQQVLQQTQQRVAQLAQQPLPPPPAMQPLPPPPAPYQPQLYPPPPAQAHPGHVIPPAAAPAPPSQQPMPLPAPTPAQHPLPPAPTLSAPPPAPVPMMMPSMVAR